MENQNENEFIFFIKKHWKKIAVASVIALVLFYFGTRPKKGPAAPSPSPAPFTALEITKAVPADGGILFAANTRAPIFVYTSREVDPESVVVTSVPITAFDIKVRYDDPLRIIIQPKTVWKINQIYKITVKAGALSKDKAAKLEGDFEASYTIKEAPGFGGGEGITD